MSRKLLGGVAAVALALTTTSASYAVTPFPPGPALLYVNRCTQSLTSQRVPSEKAEAMCACVTGGMSNEFGMEGYNRMMNAQPDPHGSADDRLMAKIFAACLIRVGGNLQ
jgi:hypothetical protein